MQLAQEIKAEILNALHCDKLELPVLPEVALRIRDAAEDADVSVAQLAKVIGDDAAIAARIVRVSNSPLMRGESSIETLAGAVGRMGITFSANLATGFAMEQMFQATSETVDTLMRAVWTHSSRVAATATAVARKYTKLKPDRAMLAGLTHAIGILPVLAWVENNDLLDDEPEVLAAVIDAVHPEIGSAILESWQFPPELIPVPRQYCSFDRQSATTDYVDVVMIANLQSYLGTNHPFARLDWEGIQAFNHLRVSVADAQAEIAEIANAVAAAIH